MLIPSSSFMAPSHHISPLVALILSFHLKYTLQIFYLINMLLLNVTAYNKIPALMILVLTSPAAGVCPAVPHPKEAATPGGQTFPGDSSYLRTSSHEGLKEAASLKGHSRAKLLVKSTKVSVVIALHFNFSHPLILLFPLHPGFCYWALSLILFCMQTSVSESVSKETNQDTPQLRIPGPREQWFVCVFVIFVCFVNCFFPRS